MTSSDAEVRKIWIWDFTSILFQWVRLHTLNVEGTRSIPNQGTRSQMLQLQPGTVKSINNIFFLEILGLNLGSNH